MAWIESHTGLLNHPKTKRLCRLLKLKRRDAVGLLHMLWWWAIDYVPEGDLSATSDEDVAEAVDWTREPGELVAALTLTGFIDEDRRLHDWQDYAGRWIERRAANAERMRRTRADRQQARAAHASRTLHESAQLPDLNRTGPDRTLTKPPTQTLPATAREGLQRAAARGIDRDVMDRLSRLPMGLDAAAFHTAAETALAGLGFTCQREVAVDDRGDGHGGRIDLLAERHGQRVAFEFDRESPRQKSITKLASVQDAARVVVLREPWAGTVPPGLDAVISPPSSRPTNGAGRSKPVLNGRDGWMGCPAGCPTNHGGPSAARHLGEDWLAIPPAERPPWPEFLARHGRPDLADVPAPLPVQQEV